MAEIGRVNRKPNCYPLLLHGQPIQLTIFPTAFDQTVTNLTLPFVSDDAIHRGGVLHGTVGPFKYDDIARRVSPVARLVAQLDEMTHLYALDERYWLVDERWGMCEINLLKRCWQSWVVPRPSIDPTAGAQAAIWWPLAALLRGRRVELIPALSVERDGWGALIFAPYSMDGELPALLNAGFKIIGRRWSVLCGTTGAIKLGHFPAADSSRAQPWEAVRKTACRAIFIIEPGRWPRAKIRAPLDAGAALRRVWPMIDLSSGRRRVVETTNHLARQCRCLSIQLSSYKSDLALVVRNACDQTLHMARAAG